MSGLLHHTSTGKGKTIVFIHGFCESTEIWTSYAKHFEDSYNVVCIDLPGHGKSAGLGDKTTIDLMADLVHKTLTHLELDKPVIIGHSLGGYVTVAFAEKFPEALAGFCFFHSSAFEDTPETKEKRIKTAEYVKNHGVDSFSIPFVPGLFFQKRREELKTSIDFATEIARKMTTENIVNTIYAMRDRKERIEFLKETALPVAFIVGKEDTAVTIDKSLAQCHLPKQSSVLFLGQTAHMGMFEREKETVLFLKGFINQAFGGK